MEPTNTVRGVSFHQKLRAGQRDALDDPAVLESKINLKFPTGYGKTFTALGIYSIRQHHGLATRMLYVVPTVGQLDQFISSAPSDLAKASVNGPRLVSDVGFVPDYKLVERHRKNECQVFATTIQYIFSSGKKLCQELMETGQWMLVIDEYHHYGAAKAWGKLISELSHTFLLAMSATPYRPEDDSAFGKPHLSVKYKEAVTEGAVKSLCGHAYHYTLDAIDENGVVTTYTTEELVKEVGSDSPEAIQKFYIQRKMRWSPKYVSPLIATPIRRMQTERIKTGQFLQVLITAMCVSHAEVVCEQVKSMFPELRIDWLGTGPDGRSKEQNRKILEKFCPPKPPFENMIRPLPELDALVHVGIAGEGLDTIYVSEVVFLCPASFSNSDYQIIGRASRELNGVEANISFDASTQLAKGVELSDGKKIQAIGRALIDAMDFNPPSEDPSPPTNGGEMPPDLPPVPKIMLADMRLIKIDSGDLGVQFMLKVMRETNPDYLDYNAMEANPEHPDWQKVISTYIKMRAKEAELYNEKAVIAQHKDSLEGALSNATGIVIHLMKTAGTRIERSLAGDIKKRINKQKCLMIGPVVDDIEVYKRHYSWIFELTKELRKTRSLPIWLG